MECSNNKGKPLPGRVQMPLPPCMDTSCSCTAGAAPLRPVDQGMMMYPSGDEGMPRPANRAEGARMPQTADRAANTAMPPMINRSEEEGMPQNTDFADTFEPSRQRMDCRFAMPMNRWSEMSESRTADRGMRELRFADGMMEGSRSTDGMMGGWRPSGGMMGKSRSTDRMMGGSRSTDGMMGGSRSTDGMMRGSRPSDEMKMGPRSSDEWMRRPQSSTELQISQMPIGMAYVPWQQWCQTYPMEQGFQRGTIFPELDLPFMMGRCRE